MSDGIDKLIEVDRFWYIISFQGVKRQFDIIRTTINQQYILLFLLSFILSQVVFVETILAAA